MVRGAEAAGLPLAADSRGIEELKRVARDDPKGAIRETARQFEALLLNIMIKSMRETMAQDGVFDSEQTRLYTSLLDQQISQAMAKRGIGIAEVLERQLSPASAPRIEGQGTALPLQATPPATTPDSAQGVADRRAFVEKLLPEARAVSRESGIPERFLIGHAALESGWGARELRGADGTPSHNLFGIKAGPGWRGATVQAPTTEYVDGVAQKRVETFRAYDSYGDALRDYASLLGTLPRYAEVMKHTQDAGAYARELQRAGYATDPDYGAKLAGVIEGRTLRVSMKA